MGAILAFAGSGVVLHAPAAGAAPEARAVARAAIPPSLVMDHLYRTGRTANVGWDFTGTTPDNFTVAIASTPARGCTTTSDHCEIELVPYGTHEVTATAVYPDPDDNITAVLGDITIPMPDEDVTVTGVQVSGSDATISWTHTGGADQYLALLNTEPAKYCTTGVVAGADNGVHNDQCTVENLTPGTYQVRVDAYGEGHSPTATSPAYTFTVSPPAPATPGTVSAEAGISSITATWSPPSSSTVTITGYRAIASPGPATCTTNGATTCVLGAAAGTTYTVKVVALAAGGTQSEPTHASNAVTPTAPALPDEPPATTLKLTTDKGRITTAEPGQDIIFIGKGFAAYSTVVISVYSSPTVLGTALTNGHGNFRKPVTIPTNLSIGAHTAVASGVAPNGTPRAMALDITVSALALTGARITAYATAGGSLILTGALLLVLTRRRRRGASATA